MEGQQFKIRFQWQSSESVEQLHKLKEKDQKKYDLINKIGLQIIKLAKDEEVSKLEMLIQQNEDNAKYLRFYIEDAFESVLSLRFDEVIQFFLDIGLDLTNGFQNCLYTLVSTSRFFAEDPPVQTLKMLISHGANLNYSDPDIFRTPLHLAAKYGILEFVKILIESGAQVNPVDLKQFTPLGYVEKKLQKAEHYPKIFEYMKSKGAIVDWRNYMTDGNIESYQDSQSSTL